MKALYLEPDEEITSVIDRLKEIDDEEVAIVVPKRAGLLQSIVNLKLLRFQAEQQKKRISLVTSDKTGRNLASAVGLTVYQKLPEGKVKGKEPAPTESAVKEPAEEIPIKFRKQPPKADEGKPGEPDADDINYKKGATPEIITKTIAGHETIETLETDEGAETTVEGEEAVEIEREPIEVPVVSEDKAPKDSASEKGKEPKKARRSFREAMKLPKVSLPNVKGLKGKPKVKDVREKAAAAKPKKRTGWKIAAAVVLALVLVGGAAAAVVLPKATVTVVPKTTPVNAQIPLTFSTQAPAADPDGNVIPAKTIEVTKDVNRQVTATGKSGGNKASGDITVANDLPRNQSLVARTRFQSPDGRIFRAQSGVVVPAGGQTTVHVEADEGGTAGNLPAGTKLSIPGLKSTTAVHGQVDTALSGGTDSDSTTVSDADIDHAKQELASQAAQEGLADAKSKLAVGYTLDPKIAATSVLSSSVNPPAGTAASKFTVSGTVKVTYFTYQKQDFNKVLNPDVNAKIPAGAQLVGKRTDTFNVKQVSEDQLSGTMDISASAATNVSKESVQQMVHGKKPAEATAALKSDGQITGVKIALFPFWVTSVPGSLNKIVVKFEPGSTVTTLPTPSAAPSAQASVSP